MTVDIDPDLKAAVADLIRRFTFKDIMTAMALAAVVKGAECGRLGCKKDARRLSNLAADITTARGRAFPD